jgi:5'-nucleotidase
MPADLSHTLKIAVSSRALFDLEESNKVFQKHGREAYLKHHRKHEHEPLGPGVAFPLIKAILSLNALARNKERIVEVIIMSSAHPDAGVRIVNSIAYHGLDIGRSIFTGGAELQPYLLAFEVDLLLSRNHQDVQKAIDAGVAAAIMYDAPKGQELDFTGGQIRIAFDGDAVIFSDESERIYKEQGIEAFQENEKRRAREPMADGPFARFLRTINLLQGRGPDGGNPFRIALVTARGGPARERAIRTLRTWDIQIDEAFFLQGLAKDGVLAAFKPHIFFDDQDVHVGPASKVVPAGRVPYRNPNPPEGEGSEQPQLSVA